MTLRAVSRNRMALSPSRAGLGEVAGGGRGLLVDAIIEGGTTRAGRVFCVFGPYDVCGVGVGG